MIKGIFILSALYLTLPTYAITIDSLFEDTHHKLQNLVSSVNTDKIVNVETISNIGSHNKIKSSLTKISAPFHPPLSLYPNISFWYFVFGTLSSQSFIIHNKENYSKVYRIYHFQLLHRAILDPHLAYYLQNTYAHISILKLRRKLTINERPLIRIQTGQQEIFHQAFNFYKIFSPTIKYYLSLTKSPKEFLAVPFLESHFNLHAKSRSGAYGLWQLMSPTANFFMPSNQHIDYRLSPYLSTLSGIHLLKQNKMILKKWDLAILAYNTGVTEIRRERKRIKNLSLSRLISRSKNPHFGFAAKNYYSEFYALLILLSDSKLLSISAKKEAIYAPYITTCPYNGIISSSHNPHLIALDHPIPSQAILFLQKPSSSKCLKKVSTKVIRRKYPKAWL